jgi:glycosyltransferase involved in cell wall biosynthesis
MLALRYRGAMQAIRESGLFDDEWYLNSSPDLAGREVDPLLHYCAFGWREERLPHPAFLTSYYRAQLPAEQRLENLILHYIRRGAAEGLSPHPLFDPSYYSARGASLLDYLSEDAGSCADPHPLFRGRFYLENLGGAGLPGNPLVHYLREGAKNGIPAHPLFDQQWYLAQRPPRGRQRDHDPLIDFLLFGAAEHLEPHPLFDTGYYLGQLPEPPERPFLDYLARSGEDLDPHPLFDTSHYLSQLEAPLPRGMTALEHYVATGAKLGLDPHPDFDTSYYLETYPESRARGVNPLVHFVTEGWREAKRPAAAISVPEILRRHPRLNRKLREKYLGAPPPMTLSGGTLLKELRRYGALIDRAGEPPAPAIGKPGRRKMYFVTHSAGRTGAPLILLRIVEAFAAANDLDCIVFCESGGPLLHELRRHAWVIDCSKFWTDRESAVEAIEGTIAAPLPAAALCNSANTNWFAAYFKRRGLRVVSLVHEYVRMFEEGFLLRLYESSDAVVFPSDAVREVALERHPGIASKSSVMGQGLLWDSCGPLSREECRRRVLEELGLPSGCFLVASCGSVDQRKGADLFLSVAQHAEIRNDPRIQFVWVGGGKYADGTALYWSAWDLERSSPPANAHFIGERASAAAYLRAADVFLLTSRLDPFPCVVHEAMSAEVPVIAFSGSGGAAQALRHGGGVLVRYRDLDAMAHAILDLKRDEERRARIGREGRAAVLEHHRFSDYYQGLAGLLCEPAAKPLPPPPPAQPGRRIIFTNSDWGISGVNSITETLIAQLRMRGWDARLLFTRGIPAETPELPFDVLSASRGACEERWRSLIDYFESAAPCIFVPGYDYFASAVSPALSNGVGIVGVIHSDDAEHYDHANRLGRYWNRIVAVSRRTFEETAAINANFRDVLRLVRSGVAGVPAACPARNGDGQLRIVYTGRLVQRQKRVLDYLDVAARLHARGVDFVMTLVGEGSQEHDLRLMGADFIRRGQLRLPGRLSGAALRGELESADVFLLLSEFEGLPVSLLEAMGHGCVPVVTGVASGISEVIEPGVNGRPVPPGDASAAAAVIEELKNDRAQRERLSRAAHATIREGGFLAEDMVNGYESVFREVWSEIESGRYRRPAVLNHNSPTGRILPPPSLQGHPDEHFI